MMLPVGIASHHAIEGGEVIQEVAHPGLQGSSLTQVARMTNYADAPILRKLNDPIEARSATIVHDNDRTERQLD